MSSWRGLSLLGCDQCATNTCSPMPRTEPAGTQRGHWVASRAAVAWLQVPSSQTSRTFSISLCIGGERLLRRLD